MFFQRKFSLLLLLLVSTLSCDKARISYQAKSNVKEEINIEFMLNEKATTIKKVEEEKAAAIKKVEEEKAAAIKKVEEEKAAAINQIEENASSANAETVVDFIFLREKYKRLLLEGKVSEWFDSPAKQDVVTALKNGKLEYICKDVLDEKKKKIIHRTKIIFTYKKSNSKISLHKLGEKLDEIIDKIKNSILKSGIKVNCIFFINPGCLPAKPAGSWSSLGEDYPKFNEKERKPIKSHEVGKTSSFQIDLEEFETEEIHVTIP